MDRKILQINRQTDTDSLTSPNELHGAASFLKN
jgi:hypothetical protein